MSSGFITRVEHDKDEPYTVIFTTDDERKYKAIEDACRFAIGNGKLQFQEVVRCKDCKYREQEDIGMVYCSNVIGGWTPNDWFCADGAKMDGEVKGE